MKITCVGVDVMRSGYVGYVQGIQPNVPACTTFIDMNRPRYVHA